MYMLEVEVVQKIMETSPEVMILELKNVREKKSRVVYSHEHDSEGYNL